MIETALVAMLRGLTSVQSLRATVYHDSAPMDAPTPYLIYTLLSRERIKDLSGQKGLAKPVYMIEIFTPASADLRTLTRDCLNLSARAAVGTAAGVGEVVQWVWVEDETDAYEPPTQATEKGQKYAVVEMTIWHVES